MDSIELKRREFIAFLGSVTAVWPFAATAQQTDQLPIIGILGINAAVWKPWTAAFVTRLNALGWSEGRNVTIEYRWSEGRPERESAFAEEFVRLKVAVIVTSGKAATTIKQSTSAIPIVLALANDPVGGGLAKSLARPGGNVTGLSLENTDLAGKRLQLLSEVVPRLRRLAILFDAGYFPATLEMNQVQSAGRAFGFEVVPLEIRQATDIAPTFATLHSRPDALYVVVNGLVSSNLDQIISLALDHRLPTMFNNRDYTRAGALMSYGANYSDLFRRSADDVDKILRGTKPGDIPIEQPTKFDLSINVRTAKMLGLTIPDKLLAQADEVFE
ncbi:MAG TPA: ABC transporter substrate-binding protein [Stellaceae bacterium]|nr:ABC transporter substrate-binding protein [Stellaceae bacterium]